MQNKTLVVIPTFNGKKYLEKWGQFMEENEILFVDTGSTERESIDYIDEKRNSFKHHENFVKTPYHGYITGALLWAYFNYKNFDSYLVVHDSMEPTVLDFVSPFVDASHGLTKVVAWAGFDFFFDGDGAQEAAMKYLYGEGMPEMPKKGIFGEVMLVPRNILDFMNEKRLLPSYPTYKHAAMAMERAWPMLFKRSGIEIAFLNDKWDAGTMQSGAFPLFKKEFAVRM